MELKIRLVIEDLRRVRRRTGMARRWMIERQRILDESGEVRKYGNKVEDSMVSCKRAETARGFC